MEHPFTTYIRTKQAFKHRLKDLKDYSTVKIYVYELKKLGVNNGPLLYKLKQRGEISYDDEGNFKALKDGPIDPKLLDKTKRRVHQSIPLSGLHKWMMNQLMHVEIKLPEKEIPVYFKTFLNHRDTDLKSFFSVDAFSNRVHSPIVNLKGSLRLALTFYGEDIVSLDVKQMQPTILAKVLDDAIGDNPFSNAIWNGDDVYLMMLNQNKSIENRDEAKKALLKMLFHPDKNNQIGSMFQGDTKWVDWINSYKSKVEPQNPHKHETHTNMAWLLQYSEVQVMTDIWKALRKNGIPFLSIHDDVLCRVSDKDRAYNIMKNQLSKHFKRFDINVDHVV